MFIIKAEHLRLLHAAPQLLLASLRLKFWIPRARKVIRSVIHNCVTCFRFKASSANQLMGQLPKHRVEISRPFLNSGVDYAGPFQIKYGNPRSKITTKCYVAIFVCLATHAIHIELVSNLTSQAFLAALRRFTARRGHVANLYSDNGTNFVGANNELNSLRKLNFHDKEFNTDIENYAAKSQLKWHFIPANSPHFGGLWEAAVKSMKYHLKRVIGKIYLTFEEFSTLLSDIQAILNSRPISTLSDDPSDPSYLTPGHFLIGNPLIALPEPNLLDIKCNKLSSWQQLQKIRQSLWSRWSYDYLHGLQQRSKWKSPSENLRPSLVVLVKEDNLPPQFWKMAVIDSVFPGKDGLVRVVQLKVGSTFFKRPITKLLHCQ
ncbi:uncharacterized protein LOC142319964 [Lycorma delicatula]|uniref:uncharacterized protein LOC142319964 n=1 Tax=Lycorma delicatula TaxID=130591 RepID=UPI003F50FA03